MNEAGSNTDDLQILICDCADELRDYWLIRQPKRDFNAISSLSISQQRMLRKVWRMTREHPEGVMLRELADKLSLSCSAVSVMVDSMVKRGILTRQPSRDDRRKVLIRISDGGMAFSRAYNDMFRALCREFAGTRAPEDMAVFMDVLKNFISYLYNKNEEKQEDVK